NAIRLLSSDHANEPIFPPCLVSGHASPPDGEMIQICRASGFASPSFLSAGGISRSVRNAIHLPSGDHSASSLDFLPRVSWTVRPDCTSASQSCETYALSFQSVSVTL